MDGIFLNLFLLSLGSIAFAAEQQMQPLLPLNAEITAIPSIIIEPALRDPGVNKPDVASEAASGEIEGRIVELEKAAKMAKGPQKGKVLNELMEVLAATSYYYADIVSGKITPKSGVSKDINKMLNNARARLVRTAYEFSQVSKSNNEKARANYHVVSVRHLMGQTQVGDSESLKNILQHKQLTIYLDKRAKLLLALQDIEEIDSDHSQKAFSELKSFGSGMSIEGAIAARLAMAKFLVRLKLRGLKPQEAAEDYSYYLDAASSLISKLSVKQRDAIFLFCIGVWRDNVGSKGAWDNLPFKVERFGNTDGTRALTERFALADWRAARYDPAMKKYALVSKGLEGRLQVITIDRRLLEMHRTIYNISKNPFMYEKAIIAIKEKYKNSAVAGKGNEKQVAAMLGEIQNFHRDLVFGEVGKDAPGSGDLTLKLIQNYLSSTKNPKEIERIKESIAAIYLRDKKYIKAVGLYKDLAKANPKKAKDYLGKAAEAQSFIAEWSKTPPWGSSGKVDDKGYEKQIRKPERKELLDIYQKLFETEKATAKGPPNWMLISHIGLLQINLGQPDKAIDLWIPALKELPEGPYAEQIAGVIIMSNQKNNRWQEVEAVSRLCVDHGLKAKYKNTPVDVNRIFGLALFNIGKLALDNKKYDVAADKLGDYTKKYKKEKNNDEALFLLANANKALRKNAAAVGSLLTLVESYPKSSFYRSALLNGAELARGMASEDSAVFFYSKFLKTYPADKEAKRAREILLLLHLGKGERDKAMKVISEQLTAKDVSALVKTESLLLLMDYAERAKDEKTVTYASEEIIKLPGAGDGSKALAFQAKAKSLAKNGKYQDIKNLDKILTGVKSQLPEVIEAQGNIRFLLAEKSANDVASDVTSTIQKDPLGGVNKFFTRRKEVEAAYQRLCEGNGFGYCAPGYYRMARFYEKISGVIAGSKVAADKKKALTDALAKEINVADGKAAIHLSSGSSDPFWTKDILWQQSGDFVFQRISGETGTGYLQWKDVVTRKEPPKKKKASKKAGGQKS